MTASGAMSLEPTASPPEASVPRLEVRSPPSRPIFGHGLEIRRDPLGTMLRWNREFGDVVSVRLRHERLFLNDPADVRHVLVSHSFRYHKGEAFRVGRRVFGNGLLASEEPFHRAQRRLVQPAFHREAIRSYAETMVSRTLEATRGWPSRGEFDLAAEMTSLTLGIAAKTMFGVDDVAETEALARAVDVAQEFLYRTQVALVNLPEWVPTPLHLRYRRAARHMDRMVFSMLAARARSPSDRVDVLEMLLRARDEEGRGMDRQQLRDEALTLLLAGHETTANSLTWALYLLAGHEKVEARLLAELGEVVGDRRPTAEDVPALPYLDQVSNEVLRLYPPAWLIPRVAIEADVLPTGTPIEVSQEVVLSPWTMHRSPRRYRDPDRFDPDRFAPGRDEPRPDQAFFPFGAGNRRCIGEPFARLEMALVLATILPRWRLLVRPGQRVEPSPRVTLRPRGGLLVTAEARTRDTPSGPKAAD